MYLILRWFFFTVGSSLLVYVPSKACNMSTIEIEETTKLPTDRFSNLIISKKRGTTHLITSELSFTDNAETTEPTSDRTSDVSITEEISEHMNDEPSHVSTTDHTIEQIKHEPSSTSIAEQTTETMNEGTVATVGKIT